MDKAIAMNWINALRSGKYKQCRERLRHKDEYGELSYCCLGVLCELYPEKKLSIELNEEDIEENSVVGHDRMFNADLDQQLNNNYSKIGLSGEDGYLYSEYDGIVTKRISLASLNDEGYTFDEIADIIQLEYIEGIG